MGLIGNDPNQVSLNGMLGDLAFQSKDGATLNKISSEGTLKVIAPSKVEVNSATTALTVTQTGAGNAFVVEDSASTDSTPFVIDTDGKVLVGQTSSWAVESLLNTSGGFNNGTFINNQYAHNYVFTKSRSTTPSIKTIVQNTDALGSIYWRGDDGVGYIDAAAITAFIDGTPGTNDMPGRLVFSTTADGASAPTERMRIDSAGNVGVGGASYTGVTLRVTRNITGSTYPCAIASDGTIQSDVTGVAYYYLAGIQTAATAFTTNAVGYIAKQNTKGAGSTITNQYGFLAESSLTGATNNYGFYSDISSGTGRWNFYANGTAANYFAGDIQLGKTVTAAGTTGAQTINKTIGSVNFAAAATSLVVTDNLVTTNSIITATVASNDPTMKSVAVVAGSGSFTLYANAAPTAETRVNFVVFN